MLSACSRHVNAVVQPLWRDVCVGVVHCLIVVLALLALLALRPVMCRHPAETLLLPALPSLGCPGLSLSLSHHRCVPGAELCCAGHLLQKTHPPDQACGLPYQHCKRLVTCFLVSKYVSIKKLKKYIPCDICHKFESVRHSKCHKKSCDWYKLGYVLRFGFGSERLSLTRVTI